jgi:hypothetical protein
MLVPSKFTKLEESTIFKMRSILLSKKDGESVLDVYLRTKDSFYDASEFLHALDILYVLGMVNIEDNSPTVQYA